MKTNDIIKQFVTNGEVVASVPFGNGHINDTFKITLSDGNELLLQKVNHNVFKDVAGMMRNIRKVTEHISAKGHPTLTFLKALDGTDFYKTPEGDYWRVMAFERNTKSYETTDSEAIAKATGRVVAEFQIDISDLNPNDFTDVIPLFHSLSDRLRQLDEAIGNNSANRLESVKEEITYINSVRNGLLSFYDEEDIPVRITHNDTKLNNVLFTEEGDALCLVDLDTVMAGYIHYDFGDVVRTMCSTAVEDEKDLTKVQFNHKLYKAYKEGYLSVANSFLTEKEKEWLDNSGKIMTFIMAVRFLTDYINGDVYYKIAYPMHNYDRTRSQLKLLKEMSKVL